MQITRSLLGIMAVASFVAPSSALSSDDILLRKVIQAFEIRPHAPSSRGLDAKARLGQAIFFDPFVSGPKSIACATCHVRSLGAGDSLPVAVGLGSTGVGKERLASKAGLLIPRNALPLFNRGSSDFLALFWDGRVQRGPEGRFESPLGDRLPQGFENLLAVASVFPLVEPDEMLGRSPITASSPATSHADLVRSDVDSNNFQERTLSAFENLMQRLVAPQATGPSEIVERWRSLFRAAYPHTRISDYRIHHVGNALSAYIGAAFELQSSPWDRYVEGDLSALTKEQKRGAVIFFGKGRCAVCHSGTQFTDFRFHGLAIPQLRVGKHGAYLDYGRAAATSRGEDRFAFRTPPLRNVVTTAPWGHNGIFTSVGDIVEHHLNPVPVLYAAQQSAPEERAHTGRLLGYRSPILAEIAPLSKRDIELLVGFLGALSSAPAMRDALAVPATVPSGLTEFVRR